VARRIVSFVREGQSIGPASWFVPDSLRSRLDVYLPEGTQALVGRPDGSRSARLFGRFSGPATAAAAGAPLPFVTGGAAHRRHHAKARPRLLYQASHDPIDQKYPELRRRRFSPDPVRNAGAQRHHAAGDRAGLTAIRLSTEDGWSLRSPRSWFAAILTVSTAVSARDDQGPVEIRADSTALPTSSISAWRPA